MKEKQKKRGRDPAKSKGRLLLSFLKGSGWFFAISILASLCTTVCQVIVPKIIGVTVDSIVGTKPPEFPMIIDWFGGIAFLRDNLWVVAVVAAAVGLLMAIFRYTSALFNAKGAENLSRTMKQRIFAKVQRLPLSWHAKNHTGDIIQRSTSDTEVVRTFLADQLTSLINTVILIAVGILFMFTISVPLALVTLITVPVVVTYSTIFYRKCAKMFERCDENEGKLSAIAQENLTGNRVVKAFGREAYERDKFEKQNREYTNLWIYLCRLLSVYWGVGDLVAGGQMLIVLVLGSVLCVNHGFSEGDFLSFITYNTMLIWPIRSLGRMISEMSKAGVAVGRIREILVASEEKDEGKEAFVPGDIVFQNVSFAYTDKEVVKDVSFTVKEGTVLGILGGTGSGKTTLALLLARLYEPTAGTITVGGRDIREMSLTSLRQNVGIVMQEPFLFSGTLGENIHIGADVPDMETVRDAARVACLDDTAMAFPDGYETVVGERGVTLSGGQKQRTAIARMLTENAPVMVFDDSLSAVDTETDEKIRHALKERFAGATVILISHRINTLQGADHILVMDRGRVAEEGTHESLLAKGGIYARICDIQMTLPEELKRAEKGGARV